MKDLFETIQDDIDIEIDETITPPEAKAKGILKAKLYNKEYTFKCYACNKKTDLHILFKDDFIEFEKAINKFVNNGNQLFTGIENKISENIENKCICSHCKKPMLEAISYLIKKYKRIMGIRI